jgi:hypothetical protein
MGCMGRPFRQEGRVKGIEDHRYDHEQIALHQGHIDQCLPVALDDHHPGAHHAKADPGGLKPRNPFTV